MNPCPARLFAGLVTLLGLATLAHAQRADVLPTSRRQATVDLAAAMADRQSAPPLPADLNNPFFPNSLKPKEQPAETSPGEPAVVYTGPSNNYELLETIAPELTPTYISSSVSPNPSKASSIACRQPIS